MFSYPNTVFQWHRAHANAEVARSLKVNVLGPTTKLLD
jgi:hypothetical protein